MRARCLTLIHTKLTAKMGHLILKKLNFFLYESYYIVFIMLIKGGENMKKSLIWLIIAVIIVFTGGTIWVSNNHSDPAHSSNYNQAMSDGKAAARNLEYRKAAKYFDQAYEIKSTKTALNSSKQANLLANAVTQADNYHFTRAITNANDAASIADGYSIMNDQATKLSSNLQEVKSNIDNEVKPLLVKADQYTKNKDFQNASSTYQSVIDLPYIKEKYYQKYLKQAQDSLKEVQKLQDEADSNEQSSSDEESAQSSSSQSSEQSSSANHHAMGDHTVNGKVVDSDTISQIKKRLDSLGYNSAAWSPQDMIDLYRVVNNQNGKSTPEDITKDDVESYLKR